MLHLEYRYTLGPLLFPYYTGTCVYSPVQYLLPLPCWRLARRHRHSPQMPVATIIYFPTIGTAPALPNREWPSCETICHDLNNFFAIYQNPPPLLPPPSGNTVLSTEYNCELGWDSGPLAERHRSQKKNGKRDQSGSHADGAWESSYVAGLVQLLPPTWAVLYTSNFTTNQWKPRLMKTRILYKLLKAETPYRPCTWSGLLTNKQELPQLCTSLHTSAVHCRHDLGEKMLFGYVWFIDGGTCSWGTSICHPNTAARNHVLSATATTFY